MSKNISISNDVYRKLKREKGDRSFSEVIEDSLERDRKLADVTGQGALVPGTHEQVTEDIARMSEKTIDRLDDEVP